MFLSDESRQEVPHIDFLLAIVLGDVGHFANGSNSHFREFFGIYVHYIVLLQVAYRLRQAPKT